MTDNKEKKSIALYFFWLNFALVLFIIFQFIPNSKNFVYIDFDGNYGYSRNCFEDFQTYICQKSNLSFIEVKNYREK